MVFWVPTVARPSEYVMIDHRAFRAPAATKSKLLESVPYPVTAGFLEYVRTHLRKSESYILHMEQTREIANAEGLSDGSSGGSSTDVHSAGG
jgi:hypothetical protein